MLFIVAVAWFIIEYVFSFPFYIYLFRVRTLLLVFVVLGCGAAMVTAALTIDGSKLTKGVSRVLGAAVTGILVFLLEYLSIRYLRYSPYPIILPVIELEFMDFVGFLPPQALFALAGIWFGAWGILAAYAGEVMALVSLGPLGPFYFYPFSAFYSFSVLVGGLVPAWAFRRFKADPRLKTSRDVFIYVFFGVLLTSALSSLAGATAWYIRRGVPSIGFMWPLWFQSSLVWGTIGGTPALKAFSGIMMKTKAYCKGWFS